MIGLDTNVLVRYFVQDDPAQASLATEVIESLTEQAPGFIAQIVLVELSWVLRQRYKVDKAHIVEVLQGLVGMREIVIEQVEVVVRALRLYAGAHGDLSDCLIECNGQAAGCEYTLTFDAKAARSEGMRLLTSL